MLYVFSSHLFLVNMFNVMCHSHKKRKDSLAKETERYVVGLCSTGPKLTPDTSTPVGINGYVWDDLGKNFKILIT